MMHLQKDLEQLQHRILLLASAVEQAVERAVRALFERDGDLAQSLIEGDKAIDMEENKVEEECLKILALHQPVAVDLRRVAAIMKINTDLERMADLASNIAERVYELNKAPPAPIPSGLQEMSDLTNTMVDSSLEAFVKLDLELAKRGVPAR